MKTLSLQRRIAAQVLGVGKNRVWFDPSRINEIKEAITKEDIKALVKEKAIKKKPVIGVKRRAGKLRQLRKKKGRVRGQGKRKKIVKKRKREYIRRIRVLRRYVRELKIAGKIRASQGRRFLRLAKAGVIKTKRDIKEQI